MGTGAGDVVLRHEVKRRNLTALWEIDVTARDRKCKIQLLVYSFLVVLLFDVHGYKTTLISPAYDADVSIAAAALAALFSANHAWIFSFSSVSESKGEFDFESGNP